MTAPNAGHTQAGEPPCGHEIFIYGNRPVVDVHNTQRPSMVRVVTLEAKNGYIIPWNIHHDSGMTLSWAFGSAVGATVNPYHRRKCMAWYPHWWQTCESVERALQCIKDGKAFE